MTQSFTRNASQSVSWENALIGDPFSASRPSISSDYTLFCRSCLFGLAILSYSILARPLLLIIGRAHTHDYPFSVSMKKGISIHGWFACNIRRKINELMREEKQVSLVPLSIEYPFSPALISYPAFAEALAALTTLKPLSLFIFQ